MNYSEQLLKRGSFMTRFSHQSRYAILLNALSGKRFHCTLDYGCADGHLLKMLYEKRITQSGVGLDDDPEQITVCQENFSGLQDLRCYLKDKAPHESLFRACDLVICTEVLEHTPDPQKFIEDVLPFCRPQAKVIISVPIEIGPSLLVKQIGRYLAYGCNPYGYERYRLKELISAVIQWDVKSFESTHSVGLDLKRPHKGHKGFDFRDIERLLRRYFLIEKTAYSPLPFFRSFCNATIIWMCCLPI